MPLATGIIADAYNKPAAGFDPITSIPWHTVFWAGASGWSHPADGAAVAQWDDMSGNGRHATQATGTAQPLWRASVAALNNKPAIDFVSADFLKTATWTAVALPNSIVVIAHLRTAAANLNFTDGFDSSHRAYVGTWSTSAWCLYAGAAVQGSAGNTAAHLLVGLTATSPNAALEVDGVVTTGNAGSNTNNGLAIGCSFNSSGGFFAGEIAFVGFYAGDVRAHANWSGFEGWVTSQYGITIS
jgi:hypothetical protein